MMKFEGGGGGSGSAAAAAAAASNSIANGSSTNFVLQSQEGCVSYILSHNSPRDACRASLVSKGFKAFANSDAVWERFLPPDYREIISRSLSPVIYSSKKELYFRLCDSPILLDDGNLSFSLKKENGKKCFMLGAKALSIAWQETLVFWRWRSLPESRSLLSLLLVFLSFIFHIHVRFSKVAELLAVCWLEIKGTFKARMLSSDTSYAAYLVYNIAPLSHGLDFPGKTWVRRVGEKEDAAEDAAMTVYLTPRRTNESFSSHRHTEMIGGVPQRRADGWMEVELGKFYNDKMDAEVDMCFLETRELHWKSGLIIEGIDMRPTDEAHL